MSEAGKYRELLVRVRQPDKESSKVLHRCYSIMLAPDHKRRHGDACRFNQREPGCHVQIAAGRDRISESQLGIGAGICHCRIGRPRLIPGKYARDELPVYGPTVMRTEKLEIFPAFAQCR